MIRLPKITMLAAGAVILALPLFAACGGDDKDDDSVAVKEWTTGLCDSVTTWLTDVEDLSDFDIADDATTDDVKDTMVQFLTDVDKRTKEFKTEVDKLGNPDIDDGKEIQAAFSSAADDVVKIFEDALSDAKALDASDESKLVEQLTDLGNRITDASNEVSDTFAQIDEDYDTTKISEAAEDITECQGMFDLTE